VFLVALALLLFWLIALVARVRHGHEDVVVVAGIQGLLYYGCTRVCGALLWCYENQWLCSMCSEIFCMCTVFWQPELLHRLSYFDL
jgi:hypothetical protein